MKHIFILTQFLLATVFLSAQTFDFNLAKSWDEKPTPHEVHKPYDSSSSVGILDERRIEYVTQKDNIFVNAYYHFVVKVMNDKGIETYNKIYIPASENSEIQNIQARTITSTGKIIQLNAGNIKEIEEDNQRYKLFALEGLEKGSEVEYSYTVKRNFSLFGSETFQRTNIPYLHAKFTLIVPSHLKFDVKGYNGYLVSPDSVIGEQRVIVGYSNDIDEMEEEKYSETDPYLQRVDYKLSYNLVKSPGVRLNTWKEFAQRTYNYYIS